MGVTQIQNALIMLTGWLEFASRSEVQARQSRYQVIFGAMTIGLSLATFLALAKFQKTALIPLISTGFFVLLLNTYYHKKVQTWERVAASIAALQLKIYTNNKENENAVFSQIEEFNIFDEFADQYETISFLDLDVPSVLLILFIIVFALCLSIVAINSSGIEIIIKTS